MTPENRNRPGSPTGATPHAQTLTLSIPEADAYTAHVGGAWVVVVEVAGERGTVPTFRRRVFLSLKAAQNAAQRARQRGQGVRVVLATLTPLYVLAGTAQDPLCNDGQTTEAGPPGAGNTERALTHSSDYRREGLA